MQRNKFKGKGPKLVTNRTPEPPPVVPVDLEKHTTITIDNKTFDIEADDLEVICELGKFILNRVVILLLG